VSVRRRIDFALRIAISISISVKSATLSGEYATVPTQMPTLCEIHIDVVASDASGGDIADADPAERQQRGVRDRRLVPHADAIAAPEFGVVHRYRCARDCRRHAEANCGLPETAASSSSHP
jgi:hypothetical protein